jgi:GT2 family glycosyltransferase
MNSKNEITFCLSTHNNLNYLKLAVYSVRKYSYYKNAPFVIYAENCDDGTNQWLKENKKKYNLTPYIESKNKIVRGIGGGANFAVRKAETKYVMLLHSDFFVSKDWDKYCMNTMKTHGDSKLYISSYRFEPNIFNKTEKENQKRYGTTIFEKDKFGEYYTNFKESDFINYAEQFSNYNEGKLIYRGEGVSGLFRKDDWDYIGGNDPYFAPASYEDIDLFLRMLIEGFKFILNPQSIVYHFGARGSHFPTDDFSKSSYRQIISEKTNSRQWLKKWGKYPIKDKNDFIYPTPYFYHRYYNLKEKNAHYNFFNKIK